MKRLIIVGSSRNAPEEFVRAMNLAGNDADIMAINLAMAGLHWLHTTGKIAVTHWVSMHPELFFAFHDLCPKPMTHSNSQGQKVDKVWSFNHDGLSGLFALKVAIGMNEYNRIIICGNPMDESGHFYDFPGADFENRYNDAAVNMAWREFAGRERPHDRIRAISGVPKEIYGEPTREWITQES
jgi:hypothetical protein